MEKILFIGQTAVSVLLIIAILMQNRGGGVSAVFGGGGNVYRTKRGLEKGIFTTTIILVVLFVAIGIIALVVSS